MFHRITISDSMDLLVLRDSTSPRHDDLSVQDYRVEASHMDIALPAVSPRVVNREGVPPHVDARDIERCTPPIDAVDVDRGTPRVVDIDVAADRP